MLKIQRPNFGFVIASRTAVVTLGNETPRLSDSISRMAEASGDTPFLLIPTFCENNPPEKRIVIRVMRVFMLQVFVMFVFANNYPKRLYL
jgi:hypothetical protein